MKLTLRSLVAFSYEVIRYEDRLLLIGLTFYRLCWVFPLQRRTGSAERFGFVRWLDGGGCFQ